MVLAALAMWVLLYPLDVALVASSRWLGEWEVHKLNTMGNVLLFLPWALAAGWALRRRRWAWGGAVLATAAAGALWSLAGETAQVWMPGRHSSMVDLLANTTGAVIGAAIGWPAGRRWDRGYAERWGWWMSLPAVRRAGWAVLALMVVKTAPFDLSPETLYLRMSLRETLAAGGPWSQTAAWWNHAATGPMPGAVMMEMGRGVTSLAMFTLVAWAMGRALRQAFESRADRSAPARLVMLMGGLLAVGTELLQWPIRSRLMDATDVTGALAGVLLGAALEAVLAWRRSRR